MIDFSERGGATERGELTGRLMAKGLSSHAAQEKAELLAQAMAPFQGNVADRASVEPQAYYVPGRIEVLGKHTDYAGGSSLVAAAERGFCFVVRPREDQQVTVTDTRSGETICFELRPDLAPRLGHWSNYPMAVARRLARNFPFARRGADIAFASDLPPAAGMSSSSALIVGVFLALADANAVWEHREFPDQLQIQPVLAGYLASMENGQSFGQLQGDTGVGTMGGSEDHVAILCTRPNQIFQYSYRPRQVGNLTMPACLEQEIPVPPGHTFAIGVSGVIADKTGSALEKYNRAARLVSAIVRIWQRETGQQSPHLATALQSVPNGLGQLKSMIQAAPQEEFSREALMARLEHFWEENEQIIPAAVAALLRGDLSEFGRAVDASQHYAERLLGNQVPETVFLAAAARKHGALAASAFGAGFGGSVWAMVEESNADSFLSAWSEAYRGEFPQRAARASFLRAAAGPAAFRLDSAPAR